MSDAWNDAPRPMALRIQEAGDNVKALVYAAGLGDDEAYDAIVMQLNPRELRDALRFATIALTPKASPGLEERTSS